jgi:MarC family integral membrane protein
MQDYITSAIATLLVITDPIFMSALFLGLTNEMSKEQRREVALRGSIIAFCILLGAGLGGAQPTRDSFKSNHCRPREKHRGFSIGHPIDGRTWRYNGDDTVGRAGRKRLGKTHRTLCSDSFGDAVLLFVFFSC